MAKASALNNKKRNACVGDQPEVMVSTPAQGDICEGTVLRCNQAGGAPVFYSLHSTYVIGSVVLGQSVVAVGPPHQDCGDQLVAVAPTGAVPVAFFDVASVPDGKCSADVLLSLGYNNQVDLYDVVAPLLETQYGPIDIYMLRRVRTFLRQHKAPHHWRGPKTPLTAAMESRRVDLIRVLLRTGISPNECDEKGVTPLHTAVFEGSAAVCIALLEGKADTNARDIHGKSPLFFASTSRICRQLCEHQADVNVLSNKGQSALHTVARAGFANLHRWLVQHVRTLESFTGHNGPSLVDLCDNHGNTSGRYLECGIALSNRHLHEIENVTDHYEKTTVMQDIQVPTECPCCAAKSTPNAKFCSTCGAPLSTADELDERTPRTWSPCSHVCASARTHTAFDEGPLRRMLPCPMGKEAMDLIRFLFETADDCKKGVVTRADLVRFAKRSPIMRAVLQVDDSRIVSRISHIWNEMDADGAGLVNWTGFKHYFLTKGRYHDFAAGCEHRSLNQTSARMRVEPVPRCKHMLENIAHQRHATKVLREIWCHADGDQDGYLTKAKIIRACVSSPKMRNLLEVENNFAFAINEMWADLDKNSSGALTWAEFLDRYSAPGHVNRVESQELFAPRARLPDVRLKSTKTADEKRLEVLRRVWDLADADGNGTLSRREVMKACSEDIRLQIMLRMDGNRIAREVTKVWEKVGAASYEEISWDDFLQHFFRNSAGQRSHSILSKVSSQARGRVQGKQKPQVFRQVIAPELAKSLETLRRVFHNCSADADKTITRIDVRENCETNPQLRTLLGIREEDGLTEDAVDEAWYKVDVEEKDVLTWREFKRHFVNGGDISPRVAAAAELPERDKSRIKYKLQGNTRRTAMSTQMQMLQKAFQKFDRDRDGKVTKKEILIGCSMNRELKKLMNVPGSTLKQRIQMVWDAMDDEGQECVTWPQFMLHLQEAGLEEDTTAAEFATLAASNRSLEGSPSLTAIGEESVEEEAPDPPESSTEPPDPTSSTWSRSWLTRAARRKER